VAESKTEAGRGRPVPLTQHAWASLDIWASRFPDRNLEHFIFPAGENGHLDPERPIANWRTAWRRLTNVIQCPGCCELQHPGEDCRNQDCKAEIRGLKSPLAGLRFHDLRHTTATKLLEQGTPIAVVAQILADGLRARQYVWPSATGTFGPRCKGKLLPPWRLRKSNRL
jgi:Phage integrase family